MANVLKLKTDGKGIVPQSSVDNFQTQQALDEAKFERDHAILNLQVEFSRRRDKITEDYLAKSQEILGVA